MGRAAATVDVSEQEDLVIEFDGLDGLGLDTTFVREAIDSVLSLHRHRTGYVVFAKKGADGVMRHTEAVRAGLLESIFPEFAAEYFRDSYVSINASAAVGAPSVRGQRNTTLRFEQNHIKPVVQRGRSFHREQYMRYLNACYCDIDCYKVTGADGEPLTPEDVLQEVTRLVAAGELPPPTTIITSGRGLWLLWHLHDVRDPSQSHLGCQPDVLIRYKDVNRAINAKLRHVGSDPIVDAARFAGLHGSLRPKSNGRVVWRKYGQGRSYSLGELERLMKVADGRGIALKEASWDMGRPPAPRSAQRNVAPEKSEACRRGWQRSANARLAHFDQIRAMRGQFVKGGRDKAAFVFACALRSAKVHESVAIMEVRKLGDLYCNPPLSQSQCDARVRSAYSKVEVINAKGIVVLGDNGKPKMKQRRPLTYREMANQLCVTREEAAESTRIVGTLFPPMESAGVIQVPLTNREMRVLRHNALRAINTLRGIWSMTYDEVLAELAERYYIVSRGTLFNDLKRLGMATKGHADSEAPNLLEVAG
jgi:hypothetical protein